MLLWFLDHHRFVLLELSMLPPYFTNLGEAWIYLGLVEVVGAAKLALEPESTFDFIFLDEPLLAP